jgi:hypothetical protein
MAFFLETYHYPILLRKQALALMRLPGRWLLETTTNCMKDRNCYRQMKRFILWILVLWSLSSFALGPLHITASQARRYIGKTATVCGKVVSAAYQPNERGRPTFLNLDERYPKQVFNVIIWGMSRERFPSDPETYYKNRRICVAGKVESFNGTPQIEARAPSEIIEEP